MLLRILWGPFEPEGKPNIQASTVIFPIHFFPIGDLAGIWRMLPNAGSKMPASTPNRIVKPSPLGPIMVATSLVLVVGCAGYWWWNREMPAETIRKLIDSRSWDQADKTLQSSAQDLDPNNKLLLQAEIRLGQSRPEGALNSLHQLPAEEAQFPGALILRGRAFLQLGQTTQALDAFQKALLRDPNNIEAVRGLAGALYDLGTLDEALNLLDMHLKKTPDALAFRFAGQIAKELVQNDQASEFFQEALKLGLPDEIAIEVAINLVETELLRNSVEGARKFWDQHARVIPEGPRGLEVLGELLLVEGKFDEAGKTLDKARELDPISPKIARLRAQVFLLQNQFVQAVPLLEYATKGDPLDSKAWNELAQAYELAGNSVGAKAARKSADEATSDLKKMSDLYQQANSRPDDAKVRLELAELCKKTRRDKLAEIWAKAAQEAGLVKVQGKK